MKLLKSKQLLKPINLGKLDHLEIADLIQALDLDSYRMDEESITEPGRVSPDINDDQFLHFSPVKQKAGLTYIGLCLRRRVEGYSVHYVCSTDGEHGKNLYFATGSYCDNVAEATWHYCDRLKKSEDYLAPQDFVVHFKIEVVSTVTAMSKAGAEFIVANNLNFSVEHDQACGYDHLLPETIEFINTTCQGEE